MSEKATALSFDEFCLLMQSCEPFEDCPRIAVAVSGGSDSLALTLLMHEWVKKRQGALVALTVDHQLRPESQKEAQQVQNWLHANHLQHVILKWHGPKPTTGLQESARLVRYKLLEDWCQQNGVLHLALGHQQEDQRETILMRILNQTGLVGLAGMSKIVEKPFVRLLRPLLTIPRERLRAYLDAQGQTWLEDPSNQNLRFQRSSLRQFIPQHDLEVIRSAALVQKFRESYEGWLNRFLSNHARIHPIGYAEIKKEVFRALPFEFQKPVLAQILKTIGVGKYQPRTSALESVLKQIYRPQFRGMTCHGVRISLQKDHFLFVREHERVTEEMNLNECIHDSLFFDQRFDVDVSMIKQEAGNDLHLKKVGKEGWQQMISQYPALKKMTLHKPILWSLPAAWRGPEILLKYNMIYEWLIMSQEKSKHKNFIFKPYYPFSCFIFSRSS